MRAILSLSCIEDACYLYVALNYCMGCEWFQALATPRELLLKKVPFPLPNPEIFNLDQILALTQDTVVSQNGTFVVFIPRFS